MFVLFCFRVVLVVLVVVNRLYATYFVLRFVVVVVAAVAVVVVNRLYATLSR